ncbi:MAG: ABC transporter permease [Chitinivibrionales bacterium]|nr:ABC transporter permease [Chitinivibrionales bacterium]
MNFFILINIALKNVMKNRMRTFLTMLGIIIGVAAVIIMVAIGQGAQVTIERNISSMGTNLLMVFPSSQRFHGATQSINRLKLEDSEELLSASTAIDKISAVVRTSGQVIASTNNYSSSIMGVSEDFVAIRSWETESGSFFTARDVKNSAKVAVLGKTVCDNLFPGVDPVGLQVRIRNVPFKVIGVLSKKGSTSGGDQDDAVYAPVTTVMNRLMGTKNIQNLMVSAVSKDLMSQAQEDIRTTLRKKHHLQPNQDDDFSIMNQTELVSMAEQTTQVFTLLLGSIAAVSLIVGGIGIMNIMLVSVTERTREIGIRLAVGARSSDIMVQFLVESVVLSMIGGVVGIIAGISIAQLVTMVFSLTTHVSAVVIIMAFLFSGAVGIFFGLYPAQRASRLNPIEALRYE